MKGVAITLAIGFLIVYADWRIATPADPKTRRRQPLTPHDRRRLWDLFVATLVAAAAVWVIGNLFD